MKKGFKKALSSLLAASMLFSSMVFTPMSVSAAGFSVAAGWNETIYAEWPDSNPDSANVTVGYKLKGAADYTYLAGNDLTYLVRKASASGYGRVDIPGVPAGSYELKVTSSNGTEYINSNIKVNAYDRSGYAHFNYNQGVGAYNNDGSLKSNAVVVYVTEENKNTVEVPGYEGKTWSYTPSSGSPYTRNGVGIGNILNNNMKLVQEVTITDNHPLVIRLVGRVTAPENLTPYNVKDPILGGSAGDNGNLAITKYARNVTIEGIGADTTVDGWGFTFSQSKTCPAEAGESFEIRNLTFKNYTEDATAFQGDDAITSPIRRIWVHNNVYYPGYCANPAQSDKAEGDGAIDFKRGHDFTLSYNHFVKCHKTGLIGSSEKIVQYNSSLHHNWYEQVEARQPLAAGGNIHIYNTYYDQASSVTIDLRGEASCLAEANYFNTCSRPWNLRHATCRLKLYNNINQNQKRAGDNKGKVVEATSRAQSGLSDNGLTLLDGGSIADWDTNPKYMYCDASGNTKVSVLNDPADVPAYVQTYAGTLKAFPVTESGTVNITVKDASGKPITDATVTASGLTFANSGNGVYTASTALGGEYAVTVSREGYENSVITVSGFNNDGDVVNKTVALKVATDGYAAVKLVGGIKNKPITGATVKLSDGTVLVDKGDGTYVSANKVSLGEKTVTITNTGDFIAPSAPQTIVVKTTGAATEIHLDSAIPEGGDKYTWNHTTGENTDNFFSLGTTSDWSSASKNPQTYDGLTLTKAIKVNSGFNASFNAPADGTVTLVMEGSGSVYINDVSYNVTTGVNTFDVKAGNNVIKKNKTETHLYLLRYESSVVTPPTPVTTEATTEVTTKTTTEATTKKVETTTETTTVVIDGVKVSAGSGNAVVGGTVTIPVKVTGLDSISNYSIKVNYNSSLLKATAVTGAANTAVTNIGNGVVSVAYANANAGGNEGLASETLFNITFTALNAGTANVKLTVDELCVKGADVKFTVSDGNVSITKSSSTTIRGDVNKDGKVNALDAAIVLRIAAGIITDTAPYDMKAADCNTAGGDGKVDALDAVWILNNKSGGEVTTKATTTTEATTEATTKATTTKATTEATTKATTTEATTKATTTETTTKKVVETTTETTTAAAKLYKFYANDADASSNGDSTANNATNVFTDAKSGTGSLKSAATVTIEGKSYTFAKRTSNAAHKLTIVVPSDNATLYMVLNSSGSGKRNLTLSGPTSATATVAGTNGQLFTFENLKAGTYTLSGSGNYGYSFLALMAGGSGGSGEKPTEATTSSVKPVETTTKGGSDKPVETTTIDVSGAINVNSASAITSAVKSAKAGDVINIAPGNYSLSSTMEMKATGSASKPITLTCANGMATLDFTGQKKGAQGIKVTGNYFNMSNIRVKGAGDNGTYVTGGHVNITNCVFEGNYDSGLQISAGGNNVYVKNCTAYNNEWAENADGFAAKLGCGENVVFDGCISYCNADDGWDLYSKSGKQHNKYPVTIKNCVAFKNGQLTDGTVFSAGDRNGFKLGGSGLGTANVVENSIAFMNGTCGFTDNNNPDLAKLTNCTGYKNAQIDVKKHNFSVYRATNNITLTNCLSYVLNTDPNGGMDRFTGTSSGTSYSANATVVNSVLGSANKYYKVANAKITNNTAAATSGTEITISDSDFVSTALPYSDLNKVHEQMRNADGSIKLNGFLQPKAGSPLAGIGAKFN